MQSEMDQASSELAAMKGRVAMQTVSIAYQSAAMAAPELDAERDRPTGIRDG